MKKNTKIFVGLFIGLIVVLALVGTFLSSVFRAKTVDYGATFSYKYAESLGLDWQRVFQESYTDLGINNFRIPVYWSDIEYSAGEYDFEKLDWIMDYAESNNLKITLAVGLKVPRWPECFAPEWGESLSEQVFDESVLSFLEVVVRRYQEYDALERWQVENEPYFPFGECPAPSPDRVKAEIELVRSIDDEHQIMQTTSGEQSVWFLKTTGVDVLGVSLYREVWSYTIGEFVFPYSANFYNIQRVITEPFVDRVIISELQAEPWLSGTSFENTTDSIDEYYQRFSTDDLESNVRFAVRTGVDEVYFWGIEWWYYLKTRGDTRLWEAVKIIITNSE